MTAGAYILAPAGPALTADEAAFFRDADPWGFIVFQRNCETPDQLRRLTAELRESVGRDAPILIDQEGGRVQRLRAPHWREWLPPLEQVPAGARAMYLRGLLIGTELMACGIDVNCSPSADIARDKTHTFLRNRCYGEYPDTVISMAASCADGLMDAGCLPVLKHAPGHGLAVQDSHEELPRITATLNYLKHNDFEAFRGLSDLPLVMTAHIVVDAIETKRPITMSRKGIRFLRKSLGLNGLLMTDDISMGALSGTMRERSEMARAAGCDLVLHCNGDMAEMEQVAEIGPMTPRAADRADIALNAKRTPIDIDIPALEAELIKLIVSGDGNFDKKIMSRPSF
ncbi:MAG: glycoside hydrolase family 3 N-terminal domain-containing protein [Pseudomonadota bacterium]